jgi:hypothetical protein
MKKIRGIYCVRPFIIFLFLIIFTGCRKIDNIGSPLQVSAGEDLKISLPQDIVTLDGSETSKLNPGLDYLYYEWSVISEPPGPPLVSLNKVNPNQPINSAYGLKEGKYLFRLNVHDLNGSKGSDSMEVFVGPDKFKGQTRMYEDSVWSIQYWDGYPYISINIFNPDLFPFRNESNMEMKIWDDQKNDWYDTTVFGWTTTNEGELSIFNQGNSYPSYLVGKKAKIQVRFL